MNDSEWNHWIIVAALGLLALLVSVHKHDCEKGETNTVVEYVERNMEHNNGNN